MASVQDVRDLVAEYVSGPASAADFANRFTHVLKAAIDSRDSEVKKLALAVHAEIAHYFNGFMSESELRSKLGPVASPSNSVLTSVHVVKVVEQEIVTSNPGRTAFDFSLVPTV